MMRTVLLSTVLAVSTIAQASDYEAFEGKSNDEDVLFSGNGSLFQGIEYDTGVYTIIDDAGLRFFVDADADFTFEMEGRSSRW